VKAFAKQKGTYEEEGDMEGEEEAKPKKKKSDPWLTGCLGLVIIAFLVFGGFFVYDTFFQQPTTVPPVPGPPATDNTTGREPTQSPGLSPLRVASDITILETGARAESATVFSVGQL